MENGNVENKKRKKKLKKEEMLLISLLLRLKNAKQTKLKKKLNKRN
jgi:hypothetical protein